MSTRCLLMTAVFALCAVGCSQPVEMLLGDGLPEAPAPRAKKTTAELLVGTWKQVSRNGKPLPETYEPTIELTKDGKVTFRVLKSDRPIPPARVGEYRLEGNDIKFRTEATTESQAQDWIVMIKAIDEKKLLIIAYDNETGQGSEYLKIK